jgi:hypothetical protein
MSGEPQETDQPPGRINKRYGVNQNGNVWVAGNEQQRDRRQNAFAVKNNQAEPFHRKNAVRWGTEMSTAGGERQNVRNKKHR